MGILATILGYMVWVEPLIAAVALLVLVPQIVLVPVIQKRINRHSESRTQLIRGLGNQLVENESTGEDSEDLPRKIDKTIGQIYRRRIRIYYLKYILKFMTMSLSNLGPLGILSLGGWLVIHGETEIGTIVAFLSGFERILQPSRELLTFYRNLSNMRVQYQLVRDVIAPGNS